MVENSINSERAITNSENNSVGLKEFIFKYLKFIPLYIICIIIGLAGAFMYLRYTTEVYNVKALFFIKTNEGLGQGLSKGDLEEIMLGKSDQNIDNEIQILKSFSIAKRVVNALNLQTRYNAVGKIRTVNIYKAEPFALKIIKLKDTTMPFQLKVLIENDNQFKLNENDKIFDFNQTIDYQGNRFVINRITPTFKYSSTKVYLVTWEPINSVALNIAGNLEVSPVQVGASVLNLSYKTDNVEQGKDIINQLMEEYRQQNIEQKNSVAKITLNFIDDRLNLLATELGDVEKDIEAYKRKNEIVNFDAQSSVYMDHIQDLEKNRSEVQVQINITEMIQEYLRTNEKRFEKVPSGLGLQDVTLNQLILEYNKIQQERENQLNLTTENNPYVLAFNVQLDKLRNSILESLSNLKSSQKMILEGIERKQKSINSEVMQIPTKELGIMDIARQQGIKNNLYLYLLQKKEETAVSLASTISNSQVVDPAMGDNKPVEPNKKNIIVTALLLSLIIPTVIIYIIELLNDKISSRSDVDKLSVVPVIGEIGHSETDGILVVRKNSRQVISEQFRIIRSNLQFFNTKMEKPVILVTSSFSGEGKSFASTNLGSVMALAGKRTVILEFDIRKPKVAVGLGISRKVGITNYLVSNFEIHDIIQPVPDVDNLFVIPCGPVPPNPSELLLEPRINSLFEEVKKIFDVVIIDTAPIGLVSDSVTLGKFADVSLFIVRHKFTTKRQIRLINELYRQKKLPRMAMLINDIKVTGLYGRYYGYSGYGYGYGFGDVSDENGSRSKKKKSFINQIMSMFN